MTNQPISKTHFAPVRKLALAAICISSWCVPLEAQQRTLSENSGQPIPAPTSSHRWLPLPSRDGSGLPDFASLYDRFKQHVESKQESEGGRPPVDLQQIEALKEMFSRMGGKLPDGTPLPNLDAIPPELLSKAMQDPSLQRQAQRLLEQFAKNGQFPDLQSSKSKDAKRPRSPLPIPGASDVESPDPDFAQDETPKSSDPPKRKTDQNSSRPSSPNVDEAQNRPSMRPIDATDRKDGERTSTKSKLRNSKPSNDTSHGDDDVSESEPSSTQNPEQPRSNSSRNKPQKREADGLPSSRSIPQQGMDSSSKESPSLDRNGNQQNPGSSLDEIIREAQRSGGLGKVPTADGRSLVPQAGSDESEAIDRDMIENLRNSLSPET